MEFDKARDKICQDRRNIGCADLATGEKANDAEMIVTVSSAVKQLPMKRVRRQERREKQHHDQQTSQS
jgi:hypothetical protein